MSEQPSFMAQLLVDVMTGISKMSEFLPALSEEDAVPINEAMAVYVAMGVMRLGIEEQVTKQSKLSTDDMRELENNALEILENGFLEEFLEEVLAMSREPKGELVDV